MDYNSRDYIKNTIKLNGKFQGQIQWCSNPSLNDWKIHFLKITKEGSLIHAVNDKDIVGIESSDLVTPVLRSTVDGNKFDHDDNITNNNASRHAIIRHLQGCSIQLMKSPNESPVIHVHIDKETPTNLYLKVIDKDRFEELFAALTWWANLKPSGIFNKLSLTKYGNYYGSIEETKSQSKDDKLLVCQLSVYGPIPKNVSVNILDDRPSVPFMEPRHKTGNFQWFSVMGVLKSSGVLELISQNDGSLIFSLDITLLLQSEIRILDSSLLHENKYLFLGMLPSLRKKLSVSSRTKLITGEFGLNIPMQEFILKFPFRIDLEDWYIALQSFAVSEILHLNGIDETNKMRISNKFKIHILEANLEGISLTSNNCQYSLQIDLLLWDHIMCQTPQVYNTNTPFWREEYQFDESVKIDDLSIRLVQWTFGPNKSTARILGIIKLNQAMFNNRKYEQEIRVPLYAMDNENFQLGTICLKLESNLQFVLLSGNYSKLEYILAKLPLSAVVDNIYEVIESSRSSYTLEDVSAICLDIFQSTQREADWFQSLINKEMKQLDNMLSNNCNKHVSNLHIYNTLFRGNSIFTLSIEKYFNRIGSEYLEKSIGKILQAIIKENKSCEIDPARIRPGDKNISELLADNYNRLLNWINKLWKIILRTSNDLPPEIKNLLKNLRKGLEMACIEDNAQTLLHSISGILFLRFFCPVILNPKLFNLTENHLNEQTRRTLTLLCKILLNFSTLAPFGAKEPWMINLNDFIRDHKDELLEYVEKITEKKLDFTPKMLKLTSTVLRPTFSANKNIVRNLPSNPYLIDKYLSETEFIQVVNCFKGASKIPNNEEENINPYNTKPSIGELEFEKITENNTEIFGNDFMEILKINDTTNETDEKGNQNAINENREENVEELIKESSLLYYKIKRLVRLLDDYEYPSDVIIANKQYAKSLIDILFLSKDSCVVLDREHMLAKPEKYEKLFSPNFNYSKFNTNIIRTSSSSSIHLRSPSKSDIGKNIDRKSFASELNITPKRKLTILSTTKISKIIRRESANNISSQTASELTNKTEKSPSKFSKWFSKR